jgi:hypothetical protein
MNIQRGTTSITNGNSSKVIDLTTPVSVGNSFPMISIRQASTPTSTSLRNGLITAELKTIEDDKFTQLEFKREGTSNEMFISWEVINGSEFTVQTEESEIGSTSSSANITIDEIDLNKSFLIITQRIAQDTPTRTFIKGELTSSTNLNLSRSSAGGTPYIRWYLVEWAGSNVQRGTITNSGTTNEDTITEIDLNKSFLIFNYSNSSTSSTFVGNQFTRGIFKDKETVEFIRGQSTGQSNVSYFVVSHEGILVSSQTDSTNASKIEIDIDEINLNDNFLALGNIQGNTSTSNFSSSIGILSLGFTTNLFESSTKLSSERLSTTGDITTTFFIIKDNPPADVSITLNESISFIELPTSKVEKTFLNNLEITDLNPKNVIRDINEYFSLEEFSERFKVSILNLSESFNITDHKLNQSEKKLVENINLLDEFNKIQTLIRTITKGLNIEDIIEKKGEIILYDSFNLNIILDLYKTLKLDLEESIYLNDSLKKEGTKILNEELSILDQLLKIKSLIMTLSESLNLIDNLNNSIGKVLEDYISLNDSLNRHSFKLISNKLKLIDNLLLLKNLIKTLSESINLKDKFNKSLPLHLEDSLKIIDLRIIEIVKELKINLNLKDEFDRIYVTVKELVEKLKLKDSIKYPEAIVLDLIETLSLEDRYRDVRLLFKPVITNLIKQEPHLKDILKDKPEIKALFSKSEFKAIFTDKPI